MAVEKLYVAGLVAYDGTDYHGYQYQVDVSTIQGELEAGLRRICEPIGRVSAAGRTDTGVHASGQVIAARVRWKHDAVQLQNAWNAQLPGAVCIRRLQVVPEEFHPRFSALERTYRYRIVQPDEQAAESPVRSPLTDRFSWYVRKPIDVVAMQEASDRLVGENDFATFGQPTQGECTVRRVSRAEWNTVDREHGASCVVDIGFRRSGSGRSGIGRELIFTIVANGFLRRMVRSITSTLVQVGIGERSPASMSELLERRERDLAAPPAPASGLTLEKVTYPDYMSLA